MQNSLKWQKGVKIPTVSHKYLNGLNQNCVFSDIKYRQNIALLWEVWRVFLAMFCLCLIPMNIQFWFKPFMWNGSAGNLYTFPTLYISSVFYNLDKNLTYHLLVLNIGMRGSSSIGIIIIMGMIVRIMTPSSVRGI